MDLSPISALLKSDAILFYSDYGKKAVEESWVKRLNKQVKQLDQVKEYQNINIATGRGSLLVDIDLDCLETRKLADYFLPKTKLEFGRASTPRSHRIYKVIDLTKKHTRKYFSFEDPEKATMLELRANDHYTMCWGQYDEKEQVVWTQHGDPTEITWDALHKASALTSVAAVLLRKYSSKGSHDQYIRLAINALWYHKIEQSDCEKIIAAVINESDCDNCKKDNKLSKVKATYAKDRSEQLAGLPKLAEEFGWSDKEVADFKKILFAITGRDALPAFTNEFVNRIAYMMKQKRYYDLEDKEMYDAEAIDVKYAKYFNGKYTPLKYWKLHKDSRVCVDFTYQPSDKNRFVKVNKKLMINVYEPNEILPDPNADTDIFWQLVKHVIPHEKERNHFLDWYAYPLQNPGKKIRHALIMQSDEFQLGKGSLFDLHRDMLGRHNTRKVELEEALDKGKGYLINAQTVLIDEAKSTGSWGEKSKLINTLKTIITEGSIGVRQLYKEYTEQDTCTNYWINTNHRDAFALPYNEVRYWVYFSPAKRNEKMLDEFHLQRMGGDLASGVLAELLDRDLSKFNPLAPAPHTTFRDEMSQLADRPLNDFVKECFNQGVHPFDRDLVTTAELFDYLKTEKRMKVTRERDVATALQIIGGVRVRGCPVESVGRSCNIWIIRNHDDYKIGNKELGKKYVPFYNDSKGGYK